VSAREPGPDRHKKDFVSEVERRRERREEGKRDRSFWSSVGAMGMVGWSVSLPMVAGLLLGRWLDARLDSGHVFMLFFMFVGLGAGCLIAWRMVSEKL